MRLNEKTARSLAYLPVGAEHAGFRVVANELIDVTRWSTVHQLVIEIPGELGFWAHEYEQGAAENQSDEPFDYMGVADFVRCYRKVVQSIEWVPLEED